MNNFLGRSVVLLVAMLGMAPVSFCATAEEVMQKADKIDVDVLEQAVDEQLPVIAINLGVELAVKEKAKLSNRIKAALKTAWHSYPYGLKHIVRAMGSPLNLSMHAGYGFASLLCVYYKLPMFRWSTEPGTIVDCAKLQAMMAAGGLAGGYLGTFIASEN